jgi:hypothetical protein
MKDLYIFETFNKEGEITNRYSKECIQPKRTKIYKDILNMLNDNNNPTESIKYYIGLPF